MTSRLHEDRTAPRGAATGRAPRAPSDDPVLGAVTPDQRICARSVRIAALRRVRFLAGLPDGALDAVDRRMTASSWAPGHAFYRAGDPARCLYVLAAGQVRLSRAPLPGATARSEAIGPGGTFGALSSVGEAVHTATAEALTASCTLALTRGALREVLREHPDVALRVLDDVAARLVRAEARAAAARQAGTVAQRVAASLLHLADSTGQLRAGVGTLIPMALSRADLADLAAAPPDSVWRVVVRLREDGIIDAGRRWTAVLDRRRLEAVARDQEVPVTRPRSGTTHPLPVPLPGT